MGWAIMFLVLIALVIILSISLINWKIQIYKVIVQLNAILNRKTKKLVTVSLSDRRLEHLVEIINQIVSKDNIYLGEIQKKENELKENISCLSHDLRTPLTSIRGYLQLLSSAPDEKRAEYISALSGKALRLERLIDDFYQISLLEAGQYPFYYEKVELCSLLTEILLDNYSIFSVNGIEPQIEIPNMDIYLNADRKACIRIIQNLIFNAVTSTTNNVVIQLINIADSVQLCIKNPVASIPTEEYSKLLLASTEELTTKKDGVSFQQFIEETYLPWYKTQVKESTYLNRATTIKKHFSYFYKMETDEIEPIHVQNWQLKLAKDFSPNYIRIVQGMLSIAFDRAIVLGIAKKNPSRMIGNIKSKKTKVDFWTLEEFQKVISLLCKKDYYEHYLFISFWLLFMTGMRIGEASALHWSDIDFETGLLSITKTLYYRTMTDYKFVEPKTQASIRTIYIDSDTLNELKAWQSVQQQVLPDCPLVLSYNGTPTSKTTLPRALEKLSNLAGVHRIKIHALRHSHASLLISMGENPLLIKERLGHEKIQTTLGTYGHLYPNTNLEVAKKLTGILQVQSATESIANYTSNQHTAIYHRTVEEK